VTSDLAHLDGYPLLSGKAHTAESVFRPGNLLREARRQKHLPDTPFPAVSLLDPNGDIVRYLQDTGSGRRHQGLGLHRDVNYLAHVTNTMATHGDDFDTGHANGAPRCNEAGRCPNGDAVRLPT
jgi:hypothetical protein